jgi:hypothetical protein
LGMAAAITVAAIMEDPAAIALRRRRVALRRLRRVVLRRLRRRAVSTAEVGARDAAAIMAATPVMAEATTVTSLRIKS